MMQSEHLLEYIDGQLDPESEQELFDALSRQPELRSALRQFISIGQAVHADREAYTPPADVERTLMAGLGITARELGFAPFSIGLLARLGAVFGGKLWGVVDAFVLGAVLTTILLYAGGTQWAVADARDINVRGGSTTVAAGSGGNSSSASRASTTGSSTTEGSASQGSASSAAASSAFNGDGRVKEQGTGTTATASTPPASLQRDNSLLAERSGASREGRRTSPRNGSTESSSRGISTSSVISDGSGSSNRTDVSGNSAGSTARSSSDGGTSSNNAAASRTAASDMNGSGSGTSIDGMGGSSASRNADRDVNGSTIPPAITTVPVREGGAISRPRAVSIQPSEAVMPEGVRRMMPERSPLDAIDEEENAVLAEVRGQLGGALNPSRARVVTDEGRTAYALGAYWRLDDALQIGLEGGRESYDQTLRRSEGDTLQIDQRPTYLWGGASLRYYLSRSTLMGLRPFAQTTLGTTSAGPLVRLRMGGDIDLSNSLTANIGGEISSLIYSFDGQRLTSARWGLTLGLGYTFQF